MNAKQIADELENIYWIQGDGKGKPFQQYADFVRQQQAEIEALKQRCLDEIFKTTYADQNAKVMEQYWQEAQAEIEALKKQIPDWENTRKPNPHIGNLDKEEYVYKMGDINWTKALK